jgi:Domain of unknown function (DUF5664)
MSRYISSRQLEQTICQATKEVALPLASPPLVQLGRKDDANKPRWSLLPWEPLRSVVEVLTQGAVRYGDNNWQVVPNSRDRYFSACQRHLTAWWSGEQDDSGDKLPHLAHAICCLLFLLWFDQQAKK